MYTIQISKHIKISFYNFCSNQFFLLVCHSANCVVCKTEFEHDLNIHTSRQSIFSVLNTFFICRLHSLCLQFKSFCPVMWIYNQNNSSVSGRSGCFVGLWRWLSRNAPRSGMLLRVSMAEYMKTCQDLKWYFTLMEHFWSDQPARQKPAPKFSSIKKQNENYKFDWVQEW